MHNIVYLSIALVLTVAGLAILEQMGYDFSTPESPTTTTTATTTVATTSEPGEKGPQTTSIATTSVATTVTVYTSTIIQINAARLQTILQKSEEFRDLPADSKILLGFFDGNGIDRPELQFLVKGGGTVIDYPGTGYDVSIKTGDYYIPQLETTDDPCSLLREIKDNQDARVEVVDLFAATIKYSGLSNCVPFT